MVQRIVKVIVGAVLIVALPFLSFDYIPIVVGAVACACLSAHMAGKSMRKTSDSTYVLGGIFGALLSMYIYAAFLGIVDHLDVGSAGVGIFSGILVRAAALG
jgi:hypothetical protein